MLLKPLTKAELIVEAEAWLDLLKKKVSEISKEEIQARQKSREIDKKEDEIRIGEKIKTETKIKGKSE